MVSFPPEKQQLHQPVIPKERILQITRRCPDGAKVVQEVLERGGRASELVATQVFNILVNVYFGDGDPSHEAVTECFFGGAENIAVVLRDMRIHFDRLINGESGTYGYEDIYREWSNAELRELYEVLFGDKPKMEATEAQ